MVWSRLQSVTAHATSNVAPATFATANVSSGSKIICGIVCDSSTPGLSAETCVDNASNSLTLLATGTWNNRAQAQLWAYDTPVGLVGTKPTITWTSTGGTPVPTEAQILLIEVSGLLAGNTTAMIDGVPGQLNGSTNTATGNPAYSSTALNEFMLSLYGDDGGPLTWVAPAGYTADPNSVNTNGNNDLAMAYINSANGAESAGWGLSGSVTGWNVIAVAFKLAAVGSTFIAPPAVAKLQAVTRGSFY